MCGGECVFVFSFRKACLPRVPLCNPVPPRIYAVFLKCLLLSRVASALSGLWPAQDTSAGQACMRLLPVQRLSVFPLVFHFVLPVLTCGLY